MKPTEISLHHSCRQSVIAQPSSRRGRSSIIAVFVFDSCSDKTNPQVCEASYENLCGLGTYVSLPEME